MKKLLYIGVLGFFACGDNLQQDSPEAAAKGFLGAINTADYETAKGYLVKTSYGYLREIEARYRMSSAEERKKLETSTDQMRCQEEDGLMVCETCCNGDGDKATLYLVQRDNRWFIDLDF